jgi:lipopolysaccharide transport system ATP-binding protein
MIKIQNLSKVYKVYNNRYDRLKEWISLGRKTVHREFYALRDINLEVPSGSVYGIIGMNGAGKSTLLKILTGTTQATSGTFIHNGKLHALLELGTGFHPELTGRENVIVNGKLHGLSDQEIDRKMNDIEEFCELGPFFNNPVRTYSSGMYVRLAFAMASCLDPDILIIDEALSVGDAYFQQKSLKRIMEIKKRGTTILFVSHDIQAVKILCDQVALLNKGKLEAVGDPVEILELYNALLAKKEVAEERYQITKADGAIRAGNKKVEIAKISMRNSKGEHIEVFQRGESASIHLEAVFHEDLDNPTVGVMIRDRVGYDVFGTNTHLLNIDTGSFKRGQKATFKFDFNMDLGLGEYTVSPAIHMGLTHMEDCFHWIDRALIFEVVSTHHYFLGVSPLKPEFSVQR